MTGFLGSLAPATLLMLLAACAPGSGAGGAGAEPPPPGDDECGASQLGAFLNLAASADVLARLGTTVGHDRIRVIHPGDAVTMDYRADRLNVELGEDGLIRRLPCG